jgi:hypothetical protein
VTVVNIYLGQTVHNDNRQKKDVAPLMGMAMSCVFRMDRSIKVLKRFNCHKTI